VFNLTGSADADLLNAQTIKIVGTAPLATVVVNTDLASFNATTHLQSTQNGNTPAADDVVWNFPKATSLTLSNASWYGTILAPNTTTTAATYTQIQGSVLVGGNAGTSTAPWNAQIDNDAFVGCLPVSGPPPVLPQGSPLALAAGALLIAGGAFAVVQRRRRHQNVQIAGRNLA
jgi:choice-of-anchor A domain-containing protein